MIGFSEFGRSVVGSFAIKGDSEHRTGRFIELCRQEVKRAAYTAVNSMSTALFEEAVQFYLKRYGAI